jgi:hypothetical protein
MDYKIGIYFGNSRLFKRLSDILNDIAARLLALEGGGGGGGGAAWGGITGTLSDQMDLNSALSGKAASVHGHAIADVTGLQTALDGKQASGSYANSSHGHVIGDTTGLQAALDAKQATLVSGTNIKTINGASVLGSGDLAISANIDGGSAASVYGGSSTIDGGGA